MQWQEWRRDASRRRWAAWQDIADNLQCTVAYLFRTNDEATEERSAAIADILKTLPADGQEALVELVASAAKVMRRQ